MKIKNLTIIIMLFVCFMFNFYGCVASDNSSDDGKLKYYAYSEDSICDLIKKYNQICNQKYDESYQIEIVEFESQEEMNLKMSTEIMAGKGPDILSIGQNLPFEKMLSNQTVADVNEIIDLYNNDIGIEYCNQKVMDAGVVKGKRFFIPLSYSPDVFITTQKSLNKYGLNVSEFDYKKLSEQLSKSTESYSLLGSESYNINLFYSFINQYVDFNNGKTYFESDEFLANLDYIYDLIKNDFTNEDIYYFLYKNINNGVSVFYKEFSDLNSVVRSYTNLFYLGGNPMFINSYNKNKGAVTASIDLGMGISSNCKDKEKALNFIKYCLSYDAQINLCSENLCLPVNNKALQNFIDESNEGQDFNDDGVIENKEKDIFKKSRNKAIREYTNIIDNISQCNLYSFFYLSETYYNSSVIGDIVNKYLNNEISKEKFIRQITAATEIFLAE